MSIGWGHSTVGRWLRRGAEASGAAYKCFGREIGSLAPATLEGLENPAVRRKRVVSDDTERRRAGGGPHRSRVVVQSESSLWKNDL
jgi:hypothetical protein